MNNTHSVRHTVPARSTARLWNTFCLVSKPNTGHSLRAHKRVSSTLQSYLSHFYTSFHNTNMNADTASCDCNLRTLHNVPDRLADWLSSLPKGCEPNAPLINQFMSAGSETTPREEVLPQWPQKETPLRLPPTAIIVEKTTQVWQHICFRRIARPSGACHLAQGDLFLRRSHMRKQSKEGESAGKQTFRDMRRASHRTE